jgi:hypothetical protein
MRNAKNGQWWISSPQRALANNSAAYTEKPDIEIFLKEWLSLIESKCGERGIFNRVAATKKAASTGRRKIEGHQFGTNPCLVGETLVAVADGRGAVSIKQLADEGKDVPVFCYDHNQQITVRKMINPRITGYQVPIFEVTIEGGHKFKATSNHKVRTVDGDYVEVKDLKPGDSLSVISRMLCPNGGSDLYWMITNKSDQTSEHHLISNYYYGDLPDGYQTHHINFDSTDNAPSNLARLSIQEHNLVHERVFGTSNPGELNGNWSQVTNDQIKQHARSLVKKLGHPFSNGAWVSYAKENNLPQSFSDYRKNELGDVETLARWACLEENIIPKQWIHLNPRTIKRLKHFLSMGYDIDYRDGQIVFKKQCSCGAFFETLSPEHCYCSQKCRPEDWQQKWKHSIVVGQKETYKKLKDLKQKKQLTIFNDLKFKLKRDPLQREWVSECKKAQAGYLAFATYSELKKQAHHFNHRVIEIREVGRDDVYNGTVETFHNFFIGGWEEKTKKMGNPKMVFVNNLNCGEIVLRSGGVCNLSEVIIRPGDSIEELCRKVEIATIIGTFQSLLTEYRYLRNVWKKNAEDERLLGVSLTGIMDHPILSKVTDEARSVLMKMKEVAIDTNKKWADILEIEPSAAITTVKPSRHSF